MLSSTNGSCFVLVKPFSVEYFVDLTQENQINYTTVGNFELVLCKCIIHLKLLHIPLHVIIYLNLFFHRAAALLVIFASKELRKQFI